MRWSSGILDTAVCPDLAMRARHGEKVEVVGHTTEGVGEARRVMVDIITIEDHALLTIPAMWLRRVRGEDAE